MQGEARERRRKDRGTEGGRKGVKEHRQDDSKLKGVEREGGRGQEGARTEPAGGRRGW